jgi:hypothetical protein
MLITFRSVFLEKCKANKKNDIFFSIFIQDFLEMKKFKSILMIFISCYSIDP